jgi:hypothetical protein
MGGRLRWLLCGAAPLDPALVRFFWGQGIPVLEGYGLTETTASATGNRPGDIRPGTVGRPMPGTSVKISPDGEVLISGIGVTDGYLEPVPDSWVDGYFRTGDLGSLDGKGRLTVHGLLGTALVTTWGKKVAPERWEQQVERSRLVACGRSWWATVVRTCRSCCSSTRTRSSTGLVVTAAPTWRRRSDASPRRRRASSSPTRRCSTGSPGTSTGPTRVSPGPSRCARSFR